MRSSRAAPLHTARSRGVGLHPFFMLGGWRTAGNGVLAGVVVTALLAAGPTRAIGQEAPPTAQSVEAGARVFGTKGCVRCHAVNGVGTRVGPDLGRTTSARSTLELGAAIWNHLPRMTGAMRERGITPSRMTAFEAEQLAAFLSAVGYFSAAGDTSRGRALFTSKQCVVCHRVRGAGGVVGPDLDFLGLGSPIHIAAAMWNHGARMGDAMREAGVARATLTGGEVADLIAYVRQASPRPLAGSVYAVPGRPDVGEGLFREKRCFECHGTPGRGGGRGPDLAGRNRRWDLGEFAAALWNKAPAMTRAMAGAGVPVPEVSAADMADLIAYLASERYFREAGSAAAGRGALGAGGCTACHAVGGGAERAGPDLAAVTGQGSEAAAIAAFWNHARVALAGDASPDIWRSITPQTVANIVAFFRSER